MGAKMGLEKLFERKDLARHSRCDGEESAIVWYGFQRGEADCSCCGVAFPPEDLAAEGERIWCAHWSEEKGAAEFCRAWKHTKDVSAGIAPPWAAKYTRERL